MANMHEPFLAKIINIKDIAKDTKKFSFEIFENIPDCFSAGQFFLLALPNNINRAYSIASSPSQLPHFDLLIKRVENGAATDKFLWKSAVGDELSFRGPMGRFGLLSPEKKQIFVATGTGLAPMRSFWQSLLEKKNAPEIHVIFGVRHESNIFCMEELVELEKQYPHFSYSICLSRPERDSQQTEITSFFTGRVTDFVKTMPPSDFENACVSLCGSKPMVEEMKHILAQKGVATENIGVESW